MQGYVDILNALDGVFAKHGALINKKYPPCPVCGREGLNKLKSGEIEKMFFITCFTKRIRQKVIS